MKAMRLWCVLTAFVSALGLPAELAAQTGASGIAGVVGSDGGGAARRDRRSVEPGAHREGADGRDRRRGPVQIVDLRPGVYTVTFSLPGFSTVRREGIELPADFTATVNAELKVGALEETVTVTGAEPGGRRPEHAAAQRHHRATVLDTLPTAGKALPAYAALIPGSAVPANAQDVGGNKGELSVRVAIHGGPPTEMRWLQDGMEVTSSDGAGSATVSIRSPPAPRKSASTSAAAPAKRTSARCS